MAIDVVITQKGLFKKPLTEELLSPAGLRMGHWNQAGVLDPGPQQNWRVLCDPVQPGRGCYIQAVPGEKERAYLRQTLPCTLQDLELFYGRIEAICRFWKTDRFTQDGEAHRLGDIPQMKEFQAKMGVGLLKSMAEQWQKDGAGILTGAVYPIYLEADALDRLKDGDPDFFQQYLARKQTGGWYYAKPNFFHKRDGSGTMGVYAITEGVPSILPAAPFVPPLYSVLLQGFSLTDEQVTDWRVSLNRVWEENGEMKGDTLGYLPFAEFAQKVKLDLCPRYDAKHMLVEVKDLSQVLPG